LQDLENQFLFAKASGIEDAHILRDGVEIENALVFELDKIESWSLLLAALLLLFAALFTWVELTLGMRVMARRLANLHGNFNWRRSCERCALGWRRS